MNFDILFCGVDDGNFVFMECCDVVICEICYVLCVVGCDVGDYVFMLFGYFVDGNFNDVFLLLDFDDFVGFVEKVEDGGVL